MNKYKYLQIASRRIELEAERLAPHLAIPLPIISENLQSPHTVILRSVWRVSRVGSPILKNRERFFEVRRLLIDVDNYLMVYEPPLFGVVRW